MFSFNARLRERKIENTAAASVDESSAPQSSPSKTDIPSTTWQNTPTNAAVAIVPRLDRISYTAATGRATFQFVPKPP